MREKTLILFDIGAVLVRLDYAGFYKAAAQHSPFDASAIEKRYQKSSLDDFANQGKIDAEEFFQRLRAVLSLPPSFSQEALMHLMEPIWPDQIEEMVALKKQLSHVGYSIGLFSNIGDFVHTLLSRKFPEIFTVYNLTNPVILSYQLHTMKPAHPMYDAVQGYDMVILIDDKDQYLKIGIEKYGWYGIHFTQYLDMAEPQRKTHADVGYNGQKLRNAHSLPAVREALKEFGVVL